MTEPAFTIGQITLTGVLGGLIAIAMNHFLANTRDSKNKRLDHGRNVIEAFRPELDALKQTGDDAMRIMTSTAYNRHESAVRDFTPYLSWINRFRMHRAWLKLAHHEKDKKAQMPFYEQYADCGALDKRREIRPLVIAQIEKINSLSRK